MTADVEAATEATFSTTRVARIVDLDRLPAVPSFFDLGEEATKNRPSLGFLAGFQHDVSAQIERDDRIHTEYVPTQVVCEYLRHLFRDQEDHPVDGLAWESAQHTGGRNVVLFVRNDQCLEPDEPAPTGWDEGKLALRLTSACPPAAARLRAARSRTRRISPVMPGSVVRWPSGDTLSTQAAYADRKPRPDRSSSVVSPVAINP